MQTTSSPTSTGRSHRPRTGPLVAWLGVSGLLTALAFASRAAEAEPSPDLLYRPSFVVGGIVQYGIILLVALGIARMYPRPLRALGFRRFRWRWVWISFAVVLGAVVVAASLEPLLGGGEKQGLAPDRWQPDDAVVFALSCVLLVLAGPFAEEVFFRGLGVRALAPFGGLTAIVVTGLVFGLVHGIPEALPPLVLFGLGLGWVRLRSASVWPPFIAHAAYNGLGVLLLVLSWVADAPTA
ncbi:MAG TPA: CPBP family intramembrane glutamic endopeptidase [Gaiellaceae bacterium]|nr:CPBP family intramembrane glutamic endopeptidase [Gaiellaceae bacterium]